MLHPASILPDDDTLYQALLTRDPAYDGHTFVCVKTTGIFCRLTCPARKPRRENASFQPTIAACFEAGFRPCQRCRPLDTIKRREPAVAKLLDLLDQDPHYRWSEQDIARHGLDPSTVRRAFRRYVGMTFLELARLKRTGLAMAQLSEGSSVLAAQQEASYESASGFRDALLRLIRETPASLKHRTLLNAGWIETPIGTMLAVGDSSRLHLLEFCDRKGLPNELNRLRTLTKSAIDFKETPVIESIGNELTDYFSGRSAAFHTPIAQIGSAFTRTVWDFLRTIEAGKTISYGEIARQMGQPTASRAVARANGANSLAIIVPCHRVVGADGSLTGYAGGLWRKQWLLTHERKHGFCSKPIKTTDQP
ncbi:trifunctional transcriptional activator/DNA repair protein Ada/methylated-DNA--[protein]-cysteine S-methyltransferase [Gluconobacter wancherniae]|uniref:bifunctional transcriptional activator/DNA repair enzyme AdaA n=1 Tax=Gluconobacter wancherniae TaxID=1307955 RepID=UPI00309DC569